MRAPNIAKCRAIERPRPVPPPVKKIARSFNKSCWNTVHRPRFASAVVLRLRGNGILVHSIGKEQDVLQLLHQRVRIAGTGRPMGLAYSAAKVSLEGNSLFNSPKSF